MSKRTRRENIGTVFERCRAYVMNDNMELVPRGVAGELVVAGPLVGRGYHKRPDLTKKVFLEVEGMRAYRTGDLGA